MATETRCDAKPDAAPLGTRGAAVSWSVMSVAIDYDTFIDVIVDAGGASSFDERSMMASARSGSRRTSPQARSCLLVASSSAK